VFFHRETQPTGKSARELILAPQTRCLLWIPKPVTHYLFNKIKRAPKRNCKLRAKGLESERTISHCYAARVSQPPSTGSTPFLPKQRVFYNRETQPTGKSARKLILAS